MGSSLDCAQAGVEIRISPARVITLSSRVITNPFNDSMPDASLPQRRGSIDHPRHRRRDFASLKGIDSLAYGLVVDGQSFALAQIFGPRFDQKRLDVTRRIRGVAKESPAHRAIAQSNGAQIIDRPHE